MNFLSGKILKNNKLNFKSNGGSISFELNAQQSEILSKYSDKEIIIGIRPENISIEKLNEDSFPVEVKFECC